MTYKLLIVDDEPANLRSLERLLSNDYDVLTASSGSDGIDLISRYDIAIVVSDQRMPAMTGIEFLKRAAEIRPRTVRIILTGYTDIETLVESINSGIVYKYLTKPWSNSELQQTIARGIEHYETLKSQHQLGEENHRLTSRLQTTVESYISLAVETLEIKGAAVGSHSHRTARYAFELGRSLDLTGEEIERIYLAALLHEIAHVYVPSHFRSRMMSSGAGEITFADGSFEKGVDLIARVPDLEELADDINFQHEHFDGFQSPNGMAGEQIPLSSRIVAVVNAYDEIRIPDRHARGLLHDEALLVLQAAAGRKYDPHLVSQFCAMTFETETALVSATTESSVAEKKDTNSSLPNVPLLPPERTIATPFVPAKGEPSLSVLSMPTSNSLA